MPTNARLQIQDYGYSVTTQQGVWRWTTRLDVSGLVPVFWIRDIVTPFGLLRDSVPLPGTVVTAMSDSITELMSAFAPNILASPTTFTFITDEGRGFSEAQDLMVTNNGVFGSLLAVVLTTSAGYLQVTPSSLGGIGSSETGTVQVAADSTSLVATSSPYAAAITIQSDTATNSPVVVPVTIIVRPKAHIALSLTALNFTAIRPLTGPFDPVPSQTFTITNTGPAASVLDFVIQRLTNCCTWLASVYPTTGTLPGTGSQIVTVTVVPPEGMLAGVYTETLRISGYSDNSYQDVVVTLTIT